jgi:Uma2 family endonuclease
MTAMVEVPKSFLDFTEPVVLQNVPWSTYESLLRDRGEARSPLLTYDRGDLLIMPTSLVHEEPYYLIDILIHVIAEEFEIEWRDFGHATYKRKDLQRGFEPDSCFYFKNELRMRGKKQLNLPADPPPDLVIEIDVTHHSLNKLPLFAAFGIPEVWRFDGQQIEIYVLSGDQYLRSNTSLSLPILTARTATAFILQGIEMSRLEWLKKVREWARNLKASQAQ